tara:strand:+ start:1149 stop:1781 length:633 start_codon:yes stop_codon:yes gene_type:complete
MRSELKYILDYHEAKALLQKIKARSQYPSRYIYSLYYDTNDFINFIDSEEGTVPRIKWRIRTYSKLPNQEKKIDKIFENNFVLEKKETFEKYRSKKRIILKNVHFDDVSIKIKKIFNFDLTPKVFVSYLRNYYILRSGVRVTCDFNLKFYQLKSSHLVNEKKNNNIIVEEKKPLDSKDTAIYDIVGDKHSRNSKYCEAVKATFNYYNNFT